MYDLKDHSEKEWSFFVMMKADKKHIKNRPKCRLIYNLVGICGLEPQTSSLSVTRSNQLSYIPAW